MKRLMLSVLVAATSLAAGGSAFAQASGFDEAQAARSAPQNPGNITPYGPVPGSPEYYGNSGWTPDMVYGDNVYPEGYRYRLPRNIDRNRDGIADRRGRADRDRDGIADQVDRDRDGDGVANRRDRRPDDPRRY